MSFAVRFPDTFDDAVLRARPLCYDSNVERYKAALLLGPAGRRYSFLGSAGLIETLRNPEPAVMPMIGRRVWLGVRECTFKYEEGYHAGVQHFTRRQDQDHRAR